MEGCIRVMAIITGVKSPNIKGSREKSKRIIPKTVSSNSNKEIRRCNIDFIV
ncbi:hypothetical protein [Methanocaldococcus villosus]